MLITYSLNYHKLIKYVVLICSFISKIEYTRKLIEIKLYSYKINIDKYVVWDTWLVVSSGLKVKLKREHDKNLLLQSMEFHPNRHPCLLRVKADLSCKFSFNCSWDEYFCLQIWSKFVDQGFGASPPGLRAGRQEERRKCCKPIMWKKCDPRSHSLWYFNYRAGDTWFRDIVDPKGGFPLSDIFRAKRHSTLLLLFPCVYWAIPQ